MTDREPASEQTPLLQRHDDSIPSHEQAATSSKKTARRRWPSLIALLLLCVLAILIIVFAFLTPSIIEQYAQQALTFEPTSLSIDSITSDGVRARVRGQFMLDANKVEPKSVRDLGRFGTWIASKAESGKSSVEVSIPEYGNVVLGIAEVPPIIVDLRNGKLTHIDFVTDLHPGDVEGIRQIASDWIDGRLGDLRVLGKATVPLRSGIFSFGARKVAHELLLTGKDVPSLPAYNIKKLNIHEAAGSEKGIVGDVSVELENPYPVELSIPALSFDLLVDNCQPSDPQIKVAVATTNSTHIQPKVDVDLGATGYVRRLPKTLLQACPGSGDSPLDQLLGGYIRGKKTTVYVKGSDAPASDTPAWITDILSSITVPVDVPGKTFGHLIKNFSMEDTKFTMPEPWVEPGTPEAQPRVSAVVRAIIAVPKEMNFELGVDKIRANATVSYKGNQLGTIDVPDWRKARSERLPDDLDGPSMLVEAVLKEIPLNITDEDALTDIIQEVLFGGKTIMATVNAAVDVQVMTSLGDFAVRNIPAQGEVPIKPISSEFPRKPGNATDLLATVKPRVYDLSVQSTTRDSLTISALANFTNPTVYEADISFMTFNILTNGSVLANATVEGIHIHRGNNTGLRGTGTWDPLRLDGQAALATGIEFVSQYISGRNTSLELRFHEQSIPSNPALSRVMSRFNLTIPTPRLPRTPGEPIEDTGDDSAPKFIQSARFHLFSSTADFVLRSPLPHDNLVITAINATANYKGNRVGSMESKEAFVVYPVDDEGEGSTTPRLPVDWETGGVGWDAVRRALGGRLKLAAEAVVSIRIGQWELKDVWFQGKGLGVGVGP